jgi:hypothetical protein
MPRIKRGCWVRIGLNNKSNNKRVGGHHLYQKVEIENQNPIKTNRSDPIDLLGINVLIRSKYDLLLEYESIVNNQRPKKH